MSNAFNFYSIRLVLALFQPCTTSESRDDAQPMDKKYIVLKLSQCFLTDGLAMLR